MQPPNLHRCDRPEILAYFQRAWQIEDSLMKSLVNSETFYTNPDPLRNLLIFYLGHSAVFYINKLVRVGLLDQRLNPYFERLFEIGVDPEKPEEIANIFDNLRQAEVTAVWQYRDQVYNAISELISNLTNITLPINSEHPLWALMMAIEHQYIHIETSSMLIRQLPVDQLQRPESWQYAPANGYTTANEMIEVTGGTVRLGKPQDSNIYGWDIEYGDHIVNVATFQASKYLITNAEFLDFVKDGGYENQDYWHEQSWAWKVQHDIKHPKFWIPDADSYKYRAMFDEIAMPFDFPVEVNHYEAIAYCRWKGNHTRLMSEAEWYLATYGSSKSAQAADSQAENYNLNLKFASPNPVGYLPQAKSDVGLYDLRGNVWEWLSDHLTPLTGYEPHYLYESYSAPYFDTKHNMMAGGSWITSGTEAEKYYRNWFRPNFYQHAGFRIAI
ncbi:5-histidylcysteine sulfoxide synthase [Pseudanabaena galeata UHCC 0370]|uniref:5-histidylcysteine sulfoxide synthase n=1 Tax=Pseudanabaena galeata UHCC 0370 TaxID=3110310 RepID=A0ABU5TFA9_9CYAN|nr:5-histidylcysteine sulfoxide synthase [Pseudanabaena galeata]MEA5476954.1 5-histidylcysteine sulfoxide synthase [Pseudanabaena galeata UHCC 0370]